MEPLTAATWNGFPNSILLPQAEVCECAVVNQYERVASC